ncbi:uncharacterized protein LOC125950748 [Anopheles darlingi]|uniref:uncharacterized protein LOC125950748 n=1 Tax=Anopheles darlingi TaxID=43151 RepID=UPI00210021D5|nr:uncharacterized protein LOC125950748 [Anopheles darlingi]
MVHMDVPGLSIPNSLKNHILVSLIKGGPTTRRLALEYIASNYRPLTEMLQERQLLSIFEAIGANINSRVEYDMLVRIKDTNKDAMTVAVTDAVQRAIRYADETMNWLNKHSIVISRWLVSQNYGSAAVPDDNGATIVVQSGLVASIAFLCVVIGHVFN